jgi:hypothetical protein
MVGDLTDFQVGNRDVVRIGGAEGFAQDAFSAGIRP